MSAAMEATYILCALLFGLGLKLLSSPETARWGNMLSALGMFLAVTATLLYGGIVDFRFIIIGMAVGSVIGVFAARLVAMTAMPEMVALLNGFGGIASLLVGWAEYHNNPTAGSFTAVTILLAVLIGGVTFSGSLIAWAKLKEIRIGNFRISRNLVFRGRQVVNSLLLLAILTAGGLYLADTAEGYGFFIAVIALAFVLGVMAVIPIGGADMPVVISLLNSYSGMAACAAGFVIRNHILIVAGSLVGASGIILTRIMCAAMNRSLLAVLGGFRTPTASEVPVGHRDVLSAPNTEQEEEEEEKALDPMEAAVEVCRSARSVVFVPGYGLAMAQAQFEVVELARRMEEQGKSVKFAVHPVAGRMPGHMHVLLSEAEAPWDKLCELHSINPEFRETDLAVVVGASDVVNPAAATLKGTPISGMPILKAYEAARVLVINLDDQPGYSGVRNLLYDEPNTILLWGDAKQSLRSLIDRLYGESVPA